MCAWIISTHLQGELGGGAMCERLKRLRLSGNAGWVSWRYRRKETVVLRGEGGS